MHFTQATAAIILALTATVSAHSAVALAQGDVGTNSMTGLGFDPSVKLVDKNKNTIEIDANTMPGPGGADPRGQGFGTLNQRKKVTMDMMQKALSNAGSPGVPVVNKQIKIKYVQMVIDGGFNAGSQVLVDETGTGDFKNAKKATIVSTDPTIQQKKATVPGTTVVGAEGTITATIPPDTVCKGPGGTCVMRVVNANRGQKWGGHICFQQSTDGTNPTTSTTPPAGNPAGAKKQITHTREFLAELVARMNTYAEEEEASE